MHKVKNCILAIIKFGVLAIIYFYRIIISPIFAIKCRFMPSCSEYAITAFKEHNAINACCLVSKRMCSCHPFGKSGYDPVPKRDKPD